MSAARYDTHDINGVELEDGMAVTLTGVQWDKDNVQGELREIRMVDGIAKVFVEPGYSLFVTGRPGGWDDWTVTAVKS